MSLGADMESFCHLEREQNRHHCYRIQLGYVHYFLLQQDDQFDILVRFGIQIGVQGTVKGKRKQLHHGMCDVRAHRIDFHTWFSYQ